MLINHVKDFLMDLVPRFITSDVGCYENERGDLYTAIDMECWDKWEDPTPIVVVPVKALAWFGYGWFPRPAGEPVDFDEWERTHG